MKTEVTSNTYENGQRVEIQRVIYDKSDDLFTLANFQRHYERVCKQIEESTNATVIAQLQGEKERLAADIIRVESNLAGYEGDEGNTGA